MKRLKPETIETIVAGVPYLELGVGASNFLYLSRHTFLGKPFKYNGTWWISVVKPHLRKWERDRKRELPWIESCDDTGLSHTDGYDNRHRTFRHTEKNRQILQDLVDRQALDEYLKMIAA